MDVSATLCVSGEGYVAGHCKGSAECGGDPHGDVGDPQPDTQRGPLQRAIHQEAVVVADEG